MKMRVMGREAARKMWVLLLAQGHDHHDTKDDIDLAFSASGNFLWQRPVLSKLVMHKQNKWV